MATNKPISFSPMTSIMKKPSLGERDGALSSSDLSHHLGK